MLALAVSQVKQLATVQVCYKTLLLRLVVLVVLLVVFVVDGVVVVVAAVYGQANFPLGQTDLLHGIPTAAEKPVQLEST
jgi:hypothetical protein